MNVKNGARRCLIALFCLFAMNATAACGESYSWNQKLTVEVETPDGVKTGSSVTAVKWWENNLFIEGADMHHSLKGEAVVIDLGNGRYLFALLKSGLTAESETIADLATQVVMGQPGRQWSPEAFEGVRDLPRPAIVPPELYPVFVTFDDINDASSVREFDANKSPTVSNMHIIVKSVKLEITQENVKNGKLPEILPWLTKFPETPLFVSPKRFTYNFAASITNGDFLRQ